MFTTLQSTRTEKTSQATFESILLETDGHVYHYSDAALNVFRELGGLWSLAILFKLIPRFIRDAMYRWIARRRYGLFGKTDQCMVPTAENAWRFMTPV